MLDTVFKILKITVVVAVAATFMVAIQALLNLIGSIIFGGVIIETFALISMYLPFNAYAVFILGDAWTQLWPSKALTRSIYCSWT